MNFPAAGKHNSILSFTAIGVIAAILASVAEALYTPLTKLISADAGLMMSVSFIFFGSAFGMLIVLLFGRKSKAVFDPKRHLRKKDAGILLGITLVSMVVFTAEIIGIQLESAATSSILQNIGTVATVLFAALFLKKKIPKRLGVGVALIVLGSLALAVTNPNTLSFSTGSLLIIGACLLTGVLYILMKLLSERNPIEIAIIPGLIIGAAALIIAFCMGESLPSLPHAVGLMVTGFIVCGLAPFFLMYAQRHLGAAKAGAIYGIYPLLGLFLQSRFLERSPPLPSSPH
ncbi:MAG TPA: DMT family transporter [Methanocorpusculum sp.]|nr:DMT family transporter [Methanocorpusculum sp.]HJJ44723.1 DMT family transporter [Methanocorpusculum sp.]